MLDSSIVGASKPGMKYQTDIFLFACFHLYLVLKNISCEVFGRPYVEVNYTKLRVGRGRVNELGNLSEQVM